MRMVSGWVLAASAEISVFAGVSAAQAQQTIRVGWTIPAEESKYWMMRRPQEFPDIGKTYNIEWTQFQGTAPMTPIHWLPRLPLLGLYPTVEGILVQGALVGLALVALVWTLVVVPRGASAALA